MDGARTLLACLIGAALTPSVLSLTRLPAQNSPAVPAPRELLRDIAQFTNADWASVERGEAVARILETDSREVGVAGAVRVAGSRERLIARYRDVESLKRSAIVLDVGRFSPTPSPADLLRAPFEEYSLDVQGCRPGDCHVRLGAPDIARFRRDVNWRASDWRVESAGVWREVLAGYAAGYLASGRRAMPDYVNKRDPLSVGDELALLLREFNFIAAFSPEVRAYMQEFGPRAPAGAEQTLYWTKEDFGIRPIFRISHQVVYRMPSGVPAALIATNQVYADHYLDAALSVTLAIDASDARGEAFYMIAVNRARTRSLSGLLRRMVRSTVQGRSRDALRNILTATKTAVEKPQVELSRPDPRPRSILEPPQQHGINEEV
jgi:hypothetical protein